MWQELRTDNHEFVKSCVKSPQEVQQPLADLVLSKISPWNIHPEWL